MVMWILSTKDIAIDTRYVFVIYCHRYEVCICHCSFLYCELAVIQVVVFNKSAYFCTVFFLGCGCICHCVSSKGCSRNYPHGGWSAIFLTSPSPGRAERHKCPPAG